MRYLLAAVLVIAFLMPAHAQTVGQSTCQSVYNFGTARYDRVCTWASSRAAPAVAVAPSPPDFERGPGSRTDVLVGGAKPIATEQPRVNNFCGVGYRMTTDGCIGAKKP